MIVIVSPISLAAEERKLFVGGLSWETGDDELKEYFEKFGEVESVTLKIDPVTGKSRCFAFIVYKDAATLQAVLAAGEHAINSKKVDVKKARAKPGKIFVGGLKPDMSDEQIREHFEQYGPVIEFDMPFDKVKNQRKGFGFITFEREETMKELIKKGKVTIGEHEVDLRKATPKQEFGGGYRGYGGGYGYMNYYPGPFGGDYFSGYGGFDYYSGWNNYYGGMPPSGGGKMRGGGGASNRGGAKRGGAPY